MGLDVEARCGYALVDDDGDMYPCDRPAPYWRWYQDVGEHEDMLDVACDWHANEGGRRLHEAEIRVKELRDAAQYDRCADRYLIPGDKFRAALGGEA